MQQVALQLIYLITYVVSFFLLSYLLIHCNNVSPNQASHFLCSWG